MSLGVRLGEDIDHASRDSRQSTVARFVAAAGCAGFLWGTVSAPAAIAWMAVNLVAETYVWLLFGGSEDAENGSTARRVHFIIGSALMTANWSAAASLFWFSHRNGLPMVGILVLTGQLIHAQAFAFRSNAILAVTAGIPASTLIVLPLIFGGLRGGALAAAGFAIALTLAYVAASAQANIANAKALRQAYEEVRRLAYLDTLTTLSNRRMFNDDFRRRVELAEQSRTRFTLLLMDLDGLKTVNDRHGHAAGDAVLIEVSTRLRSLTRASDLIARVGGDEFAMLIADMSEPAQIDGFCARIVDALSRSFEFQGATLTHTPSMGVAVFPDHGRDQDSVYKAADLALYAAKRGGRNTWRLYAESLAA